MTLLPKVKLKAAVNFPATVLDGTGIDVTKSNGSYRFDLDFADFAPPVSSLSDPTHQNALLWNSATGSYDLIPASILVGAGVFPATAFPLIESGSGAVGLSNKYAREDHVHPISGNTFLQAGAGTVIRTPQDKMRDVVSVKDFGAAGDGVTNDTTAIQAAIAAGIAGSKAIYVPGGTYIVSALVADLSAVGSVTAPRFTLYGDGYGLTRLLFVNGNINGLTILGSTGFALESFTSVRGIMLQKADKLGSGIDVQNGAYVTLEGVYLGGWNNGFHGISFLSSKLDRVISRGNVTGAFLENGTNSAPNAITLNACVLSANTEYGLYTTKPSTLTVNGGSIENNGISGASATRGGVNIIGGALHGGAGACFNGVYFENNATKADIYISASDNPTIVAAIGCTFNRNDVTNFVTNNIISDGTQETKIYVAGCAFKRLNTYVANAGRPYFSLSATSKLFLDGNTYSDTSEQGVFENRPSLIKGGQVNSAGTAIVLPIGWTSSRSSAGVYIITHNLGTVNYGIAATSTDGAANYVQRVVPAANSFTVATTNTSAVLTDCPFGFVLTMM